MPSRRILWPAIILVLVFGSLVAQQNQAILSIRNTAVDVLAPLQSVTTSLFRTSANLAQALREAQEVDRENRRLRQMVEELRRENVELREAAIQSRWLLRELEYGKAHPDHQFLSARVIAWDPSNLIRAVVIDRGRAHGVGQGMVVVSPSGLVGKVTALSEHWAKVLLITDPRSSVNGVVQGVESRPKGVLQGRPEGLLTMKYLPPESQVRKGDALVTSGLGGGFPPGLLVGWVVETSYNDIQMFQEALVKPAVSFADLESVLVITSFSPTILD